MIAPFVDEDTAFVGYFDLVRLPRLTRLTPLLEKTANLDDMPAAFAEKLNALAGAVEKLGGIEAIRRFDEITKSLVNEGITDFFILYNMKDGVNIVVPNIDSDHKASILENAMSDTGLSRTTTSLFAVRTKDGVVIFGGPLAFSGPMSLDPYSVFLSDKMLLKDDEKLKRIVDRFTGFRARENPLLIEAFEAADDADVFKAAILFPDSYTVFESFYLKFMAPPVNEYSFSFLKGNRRFACFGIDSEKRELFFITKTPSPQHAKEYAGFIDAAWRKIIANYLRLTYVFGDGAYGLSYAQIYELCVALLPKADGTDVCTVINAEFIEKQGPGILETMLESKITLEFESIRDRPFGPEEILKPDKFYLNENKP